MVTEIYVVIAMISSCPWDHLAESERLITELEYLKPEGFHKGTT